VHVGIPASGIRVKIFRAIPNPAAVAGEDEADYRWETSAICEVTTNTDGRGQLVFDITPGSYKMVFYVAPYFERTGSPSFYTKVDIMFRVADPASHYHVPLILSPFGYSTYRGS
jgi:5-hydroxyisourate hydrolase